MFPFWEMVVAPIVKATNGRRVLEIGALRGETTAKMFDQLGPESELHVIDPLPQFDPAEHEAQFPGRYVFHRALSLDVLADLPPMDVALIDGDHNWYTVYNELKALAATARQADQTLPVLVLHDVAWPYGHRDLYYEPSQIPEEFRRPWRRAGIVPGFIRLRDDGGMNLDLANAIEGGGPRNGVMCALEDFLAEHDRPVRHVHLPFYFGLSIVVEEERLADNASLAGFLDHLESAEGRERLLKLSERIRIDAVVYEHNWNRIHDQEVAGHRQRYLALLKAAVLDEHYLENEVRIDYLTELPAGSVPDPAALRDPMRTLPMRYERLARAREAGQAGDIAPHLAALPYTASGRAALDHLERTVATLDHRGVAGDVAEVSVGRGGVSVFLRGCMEAHGLADRTLWVVDRFVASDHADLNQVRDGFDRFGLAGDGIRFVQGPYEATLVDDSMGDLALLRVGAGIGGDLEAVLRLLLPRVVPGGTVVVEGVGDPDVHADLGGVLARLGVTSPLERIDWNNVTWESGAELRPAESVAEEQPQPDELDLSVVVVFYNMRREAARTLLSLSRSYQRDIDDLRYEVLVVDNGSAPDQRLTAEEVAGYGPEFRLIEIGAGATPSPTPALNRGIAEARGRTVALMIDGAHVLTPGVLRFGLAGMETYAPAVVATQQWYVGPGQQGDAQQLGYDQDTEDKLLRGISWPEDGYRLFEVGHFIGDRDWFDGMFESNCLFVSRDLLEQVGGFDDSFDMAGGGYANLELFERLALHPGVNAVSILGEGTFHQIHGGTTTNVLEDAVRRDRVASYGEHFANLRGRPLLGLQDPLYFVGSLGSRGARRTRARRALRLNNDPHRDPVITTPTEPTMVPDEVKFAAIEALWEAQSWREATWLGHRVNRFPTDLQSYQELVSRVRPATMVIIGDDDGVVGRALYLAAVADQLDEGQVVVVGRSPDTDRPPHPRVTYVDGAAEDERVIGAVADAVGGAGATVFIGLGAMPRVVEVFEAYEPLVPVGGYVVVENTVVNGRPVVPDFGSGPQEAVVTLLGGHRDFVPDIAYERYTVTFNKGGFLRRLAPA